MDKRNPEISLGSQSVSIGDIEATTRLVHSLELLAEQPRASNANAPTQQQLVKLARRICEMRKTRARFFDVDLFGEQAWDIILALYLSDAEGYRLKAPLLEA